MCESNAAVGALLFIAGFLGLVILGTALLAYVMKKCE